MNKPKVSLEEFVKTGKFGKIELGMSKAQVIEYLGNDYAYGDFDLIEIIHYDWFEFFFWKESQRLVGIQNDSFCYEGLKKNYTSFKFDTWFLSPKTPITYSFLKTYFEKNNISFEEKRNRADVMIWDFESGASFDFIDEIWKEDFEKILNKEDYILGGIRHHNMDFI